jgi:uncharacterized tellurite resistance protein B-like protein
MYSEKFYESIGHAFYAVAHANQKVDKKEIDTLIKIVRNEWASLEDETDEFGEDAAFHIISVFDWLTDNDVKEKEAIQHFKEYVSNHQKLFTPDIKNKILKTCEKIAASSHKTSKNENKVIQEIKQILNL